MNGKSPITTHVLDTAAGRPAAGVQVELLRPNEQGVWETIARGETDADGRLNDLLPAGSILPGRYRLTFATGEYFIQHYVATFHPEVTVDFTVTPVREHYHVPLLLSPYGYTTYRGS